MQSFRVQSLRTLDALSTWIDNWQTLSGGVPFCQPDWLLPWIKHFLPAQAEPHVTIVIDEENRLRALLPTYFDAKEKSLRLLGDRSVCSDYVSLLIDDQTQDENLATVIAQYLMDPKSSDCAAWQKLHLEAVNQSSRTLRSLRRELEILGAKAVETRPSNTWIVDLEGGWSHFLTAVSKNSRKAFRKRSEELEKVRVRWVNDRSDLKEYFPILIELHQKRRQMVGDPGCFSDPRFEPFLQETAQLLLERSQLQAFTLWIDDKPVAAELGYRSKDRWFCYQAGIDPAAMEHEPGKLTNIYMLKNAERFGITKVDFLRGDEPYKQQLKANPMPLVDWIITRPTMSGRANHAWLVAKQKLKQTLQFWQSKKPTDSKPIDSKPASS